MERETENVKTSAAGGNFLDIVKSVFSVNGSQSKERKPWYKLPLAKRIVYLVLSVLLAMLVWGYVLVTKDPPRRKTFSDIAITFESGGEADILSRNLTIYGDLSETLKQASVTVSAPLTEMSKLSSDSITATVSLNSVYAAGTYELEVKANSTVGTVVSIEPSTVKIVVDDIVRLSVPIAYDYQGELPEGYWHDAPTLSGQSTTVSGAKTDLMNVSRAICYIDLDNVTESMNRTIQLRVLDSNGQEIPSSVFKDVIPAVTVQMRVLPHAHFPVLYEIADQDKLPDIFEITDASLNYASIDIAAEPDDFRELTAVNSEPVFLGTITEAGTYTLPLTLYGIPANSVIIDGTNPQNVQLSVTVSEKHREQKFENVPIRFLGEDDLFKYEHGFETVDVTVSGPTRLVQGFVTADMTVSVNVAGRAPGEYELNLEYTFKDFDMFKDLNVTFAEPTVRVKITRAE